MKQFPTIISKLFYEPLAITPNKHAAICRVLDMHSNNQVSTVIESDDDESDDPAMRRVKDAAIIPCYGVIGKHLEKMASASPGCDLDDFCGMIDMAEANSKVKRLIFDFRTPGGTITGLPEAARKIFNCSKETIAFTDSECCSAGVWMATQCQRFFSTQSATVGSVGVWCAYMDYSRMMQNEGINMQAISAGKYKLMGAYWKPLSDDEKATLQKSIDKTYAQFKDAVNSRRSLSEDSMGNGMVFDGEEAVERGLVDGVVESMEDILDDMV